MSYFERKFTPQDYATEAVKSGLDHSNLPYHVDTHKPLPAGSSSLEGTYSARDLEDAGPSQVRDRYSHTAHAS